MSHVSPSEQYYRRKTDGETKWNLAEALLANFAEEAVAPIWKFVEKDIGEERHGVSLRRLQPVAPPLQLGGSRVQDVARQPWPQSPRWHRLTPQFARFRINSVEIKFPVIFTSVIV